ncbi:MAG: radical SAM protein [Nitrospiraceae bacterium]|nr:MAG: radical SAM protein [Nitrospiraceae bacterium]
MILIHPPVAKPSEPPAGVARLAGALSTHRIRHTVLDANLEGLLYLIDCSGPLTATSSDKWTSRSFRNASDNYSSLRNWQTYLNIDRYKRAVIDLDHAIEKSVENGVVIGLANYKDSTLSPLRSADLIKASERPEINHFYPYFSKRLRELIEKNSYSSAGFSLNYLSQALSTFAMIGFMRRSFPETKIILGGGLVTSWMNNPEWKDPFTGLVDHIIDGPGEGQLLSILGIDETNGTQYTPALESLPLNDYLSPGRILPYSASGGCYWKRCSFCPEKAEDNPYIPLAVDRVMEDLDSLIMDTKPSLVHLLDNAISPALLNRLAAEPPGVPWYGFARVSGLLTDFEFCRALKDSGCVMLKLGLESGDQTVLDKMQKGTDIETASLVLKTLKKAGISTYVYLLFGTPPETLTEARNTLEFVLRHKDETGFLNVALFNMPVCGPEMSGYRTSSFYEGDLSLYTDFTHPQGWGRKQVRQFLDNEFKRHPAISAILQKDPPVFTSNHAPLFVMQHE